MKEIHEVYVILFASFLGKRFNFKHHYPFDHESRLRLSFTLTGTKISGYKRGLRCG